MGNLLNKNKKISLVIGIVMAVLVGLSVPVKAGNDSEKKSSSLSEEDRQFFKEYFSREQNEPESTIYYIYDLNGDLIYESIQDAEITDEKLQSLLIQSDLIMNFDNISYLVLD